LAISKLDVSVQVKRVPWFIIIQATSTDSRGNVKVKIELLRDKDCLVQCRGMTVNSLCMATVLTNLYYHSERHVSTLGYTSTVDISNGCNYSKFVFSSRVLSFLGC